MTVSYTAEVATASGLGCFLKLLRRWRGSIYKLVWLDLILFLGIYYALNITYHYWLYPSQKVYFQRVITYCEKYSTLIPLSFVLGFFVNIVFTRWWSQYTSIPFPDNTAILIGASIKGQDERSRLFRRTIVRYLCVTFTMTMTLISQKIKKRFPTLQHFVQSGLLTEEEVKIIEEIDSEFPNHTKYWLPLAWASNVTTRARHEGVIKDEHSMMSILEYLNEFRTKCSTLLNYDWISIPLVYTQVVTLAVYGYFLIKVIGCQFVSKQSGDTEGDLWLFSFPFMPIVEFFFYMGWLKVAEALINPFGDDDDDFEIMWMIDRHVQVCYVLVDRIHQDHPKLIKDAYWDEIAPITLPFTVASQEYISEYPECSTNNINIKHSDQEMIMPEILTKIDTPDNRHSWKFWKKTKKIFKSRKTIPLKRVITNSHDQLDQINSDEDISRSQPHSLLMYPNQNQCAEFENLKLKRMKDHKEKMLKYFQILKSQNSEDEKLLDSLLTNGSD